MSGHECQARVRQYFTVAVSRLNKKDKLKEFYAGQWLKGRLVEVHGKKLFRSGKFLLNPLRFDRFKFPDGEGPSVDELDSLLKSAGSDVYDPYKLLS